jgi:hypothetical protein
MNGWAFAFLLGYGMAVTGGNAGLQQPQLGHRESGAPTLSGYMINGVICLPIKRFAFDSGYQMSVSPSRKHVAILVGKHTAYLYNGTTARVDKDPFPLSITPLAKNDDWYVPLPFFEKIYPVRFTYVGKSRVLKAELPGKTFQIPIEESP